MAGGIETTSYRIHSPAIYLLIYASRILSPFPSGTALAGTAGMVPGEGPTRLVPGFFPVMKQGKTWSRNCESNAGLLVTNQPFWH